MSGADARRVHVHPRSLGWTACYLIHARMLGGGVSVEPEWRTLWRPSQRWARRVGTSRMRRSRYRLERQHEHEQMRREVTP